MMRLGASALLFGHWIFQAAAIHVATGSPCESLCGNVLDATTPNDIVCEQSAYSASSAGTVYQQCVTCELRSPYANSRQTDVQWLLYNLRYALSFCLFGFPANPNIESSPCLTSKACEPLARAIEFNSLAPNATAYGYCSFWDEAQVPMCRDCLRPGGDQYLANFLTILDAGCEQRPVAGSTVSVEGTPFSNTAVNITDPTPTGAIYNYNSGPLSLGAKVGIAAGGAILLLITAGFCIVWNGKRRRRAFLRTLETKHSHAGWPTPINTHDMFETPLSQRPLRTWDDSPMTAQTETPFPRYFSPYSSQYNSPVSAVDGPSMQWPVDRGHAQSPPHEIGIALGGEDPADRWDGDAKGKHRTESYEMRQVDAPEAGANRFPTGPNPHRRPSQSSHGRHVEHSPTTYQGLTEDDARRGNAL